MNLHEALEAAPPATKGPPCSVRMYLSNLAPDEVQQFQNALEDPQWTDARLSQALELTGVRISKWTIGYHRRGDCLCRHLSS